MSEPKSEIAPNASVTDVFPPFAFESDWYFGVELLQARTHLGLEAVLHFHEAIDLVGRELTARRRGERHLFGDLLLDLRDVSELREAAHIFLGTVVGVPHAPDADDATIRVPPGNRSPTSS